MEVDYGHLKSAVDAKGFWPQERGPAMHGGLNRRERAVLQIGMISTCNDLGCACDMRVVIAYAFRMHGHCSKKKHRNQCDSVQNGAKQLQARFSPVCSFYSGECDEPKAIDSVGNTFSLRREKARQGNHSLAWLTRD